MAEESPAGERREDGLLVDLAQTEAQDRRAFRRSWYRQANKLARLRTFLLAREWGVPPALVEDMPMTVDMSETSHTTQQTGNGGRQLTAGVLGAILALSAIGSLAGLSYLFRSAEPAARAPAHAPDTSGAIKKLRIRWWIDEQGKLQKSVDEVPAEELKK